MNDVLVLHAVSELRAQVARWRAAGETVGFVPTMGALHAGHISLVKAAQKQTRRVVVSIFVNPTQFAPNEDYSAYPRTLDADLARLREGGADAAFVPSVHEMYPPGACTTVSLKGPATAGLEDAFRPAHFAGVATVVTKLLNQCGADAAFFGEKDFQQLQVISTLARDLDIPTRIAGVPTMREPDGLAMSSRNVYLSKEERAVSATLPKALSDCAGAIRGGADIAASVAAACEQVAAAGFVIDYIEARHAGTLAPAVSLEDGPVRLLAAARIGRTRLIDNMAV